MITYDENKKENDNIYQSTRLRLSFKYVVYNAYQADFSLSTDLSYEASRLRDFMIAEGGDVIVEDGKKSLSTLKSDLHACC